MPDIQMILFVAFGGAVGAVSRLTVTQLLGQWFGRGYPWGTLAVNVLGSFIIGFLVGLWSQAEQGPSSALRAAIIVGFLGAFTTMSSFSLDSWELLRSGDWFKAFSYMGVTLLGSLLAVALGFYFTLKN